MIERRRRRKEEKGQKERERERDRGSDVISVFLRNGLTAHYNILFQEELHNNYDTHHYLPKTYASTCTLMYMYM